MNATIIPRTPIGPVAIRWTGGDGLPVVVSIQLPRAGLSAAQLLRRTGPKARAASCAKIDALARFISALLNGKRVRFSLDLLALGSAPPFQQAVLRAAHRIPRGQVRTYGELAAQLGRPGAARAVGNALAHNPFPLVIPCHRVVRAGGRLGGFGGGSAMKRDLLALEGIVLEVPGRPARPGARREIPPRQSIRPLADSNLTSRRSP